MGTVSEIYASALGASCAECYRKAQRIRELEAQLAALDWTPITESNLPKVGDEVLDRSFSDPDEFMITIVAHDWDARQLNPALAGYQFRRPIAAPAGESRKEK